MAVKEAWSLFPVINSGLYKGIISTFGESYKLFHSNKSPYFTKPLFLNHSALKYLSLWPNDLAVSFLSIISWAALPVTMSPQQPPKQSEPALACFGSMLAVSTVSVGTVAALGFFWLNSFYGWKAKLQRSGGHQGCHIINAEIQFSLTVIYFLMDWFFWHVCKTMQSICNNDNKLS